MTTTIENIILSETSYSFYTAGIMKGRVEAILGVIEQLNEATVHYRDCVIKYNKDSLDTNNPDAVAASEFLGKVIESFSKLPSKLEESIPAMEKEATIYFTKAKELDESSRNKTIFTRISNSITTGINGFITGFNR